jgi:hypothetical protein
MLIKEFTTDGHVYRVVVSQTWEGWEVRTERDGIVIKRRIHTDWHRVERAVQWFDQVDYSRASR